MNSSGKLCTACTTCCYEFFTAVCNMGDRLTCCTSHWSTLGGLSNATEPRGVGVAGICSTSCSWRRCSNEGRYCTLAGYPLVGPYMPDDDDAAPLSGHVGNLAPRCRNCSWVLSCVRGLAWSAPVSAWTGCGVDWNVKVFPSPGMGDKLTCLDVAQSIQLRLEPK